MRSAKSFVSSYDEKVQGKTSQVLRKVKVAAGELEALFNIDANCNFEIFMDMINRYTIATKSNIDAN